MYFVQRFHIFLRFLKYCCFRTFAGPKCNFMPMGIQISFEMAEIFVQNGSKWMFFLQCFHIFCVFPNIVVLEPSRDQKATFCQRASQWVSKWLRKTRTDKPTDRHFRIYYMDVNLILVQFLAVPVLASSARSGRRTTALNSVAWGKAPAPFL